VNDSTGVYSFTYDNDSRLLGASTQYTFLPGLTYTNSYTYDAMANRKSFSAPGGVTDAYEYDPLNRLTIVTDSLLGQFTFDYDALSRQTAFTRPNGVSTVYSYDSASQMLNILHKAGISTLDGAAYTYDNAGHRTSKTNYRNNITEQYSYDPTYQLTQVTQGDTTTETYSYDAVGNRVSSMGVYPYLYNASNQLISTPQATFTYDENGNTLTKADSNGTTTYRWDFENRLKSVTLPGTAGTITFTYDPFGRRIQKASPASNVNYLYDGASSIAELDASGALLVRYAQGPGVDKPLAEKRGGNNGFYEQDGLGSVTSITDSGGAVLDSYVYDSFGNISSSSESLVNALHYTGRDFDAETGLLYYRARYYDATVGRFVTEDPARFTGGIDFYAYVLNDPVELNDPMGAYPCLNIKNFVDFMNKQDQGKTNPKGDCAQSVKNGLDAGFGGKQGETLHNGPQNYGPGLEKLGFVPINNNSPLKPGDVMIFQTFSGRPWGHIQMWNGSNWLSDYIQKNRSDGYPGPSDTYKNANPSYQLYRDPNVCP